MTTTETLDRLDAALAAAAAVQKEIIEASRAALTLARSQTKETEAKLADDDEWTRLPKQRKGERCKVTGWSRGTLENRIKEGEGKPGGIRKKTVGGIPYYSAADARKYLTH